MSKFLLRSYLLAILLAMGYLNGNAQTITTVYTGAQTGLSATNATITFGIQNTNASAMNLTALGYYMPANTTRTWELWYKAAPLTGLPGAISVANGWTQIATNTMTSGATAGITTILPSITFSLPATTTYRFALVNNTTSLDYFSNATPNVFSNSGVNLLVGNNPLCDGYAGNQTGPTITPRYFWGSITFNLGPPPTCPMPTAPTATGVTSNSAILDWTYGATPVPIGWHIKYGAPGFNPTTGGTSIFTTLKPYNLTGLTPLTSYEFRVRAICTIGDTSLWSQPAPFTTLCAPPASPTANNVTRCGHGTATINASLPANTTAVWYNVPTAGTPIFNGNPYTTPFLTNNATYYVASRAGGGGDSVAIPLATGNTLGVYHHMFVVNALQTFTLDKIGIRCNMPVNTASSWQIYYRPNNYQLVPGANTSSAGWTLIATTNNVPSAGLNDYTIIASNLNITLSASSAHSFYIAPVGSTTHQYSSPVLGTIVSSNTDAQLVAGNRGSSLFNCVTSGGMATVKLTYSKGCESPRVPVNVSLTTAPAITISSPQAPAVCVGTPATLNAASATNPNYTYTWQPGNLTGNSVTVTPATSTNYVVYANDNNASSPFFGCFRADTFQMAVISQPGAGISPPVLDTYCKHQPVLLTATTNNGSAYQWYYNNTAIPNATNAVYSAVQPGKYHVRVFAPGGCFKNSDSVIKTDYLMPTTTINYNSDLEFCEGGSVVLTAQTGSNFIYQWYKNNLPIGGAIDTLYEVLTSGKYSLVLTNHKGCNSDEGDTIEVIVKQQPTPTIVRNGLVLSTGIYNSYQWYRNNAVIPGANNQNYTMTQPGAYLVEVVDTNFCTGRSKLEIITSLSISSKAMQDDNIFVHPNPVNSVLHITAPYEVNARLYSSTGQLVQVQEKVRQINFESLPAGLYYLHLTNQKGTAVKTMKVTKQ